jgi:hypothetical protein
MKQIITLAVSNNVSLEKFLKQYNCSVFELNDLTKRTWESLVCLFGNDSVVEEQIEVMNVETIPDRLN